MLQVQNVTRMKCHSSKILQRQNIAVKNIAEMKCRNSKMLQGQNVAVVNVTADGTLSGCTMLVEMSHGCFEGGCIIKALLPPCDQNWPHLTPFVCQRTLPMSSHTHVLH